MNELLPRQSNIQDSFWSPRLQVNAQRAIYHQWEQLEASHCIDNFRLLTGECKGFREGWFFADSDAYKWLDAASRLLAIAPDPHLVELVDPFIGLLGRAQAPDGYLFTYNQIHFPGQRWLNLQIEHELYCHGHLIEAGVSHFRATGREDLLSIARRSADLLASEFIEAGPERTPGHEEVEIALLRLFEATGEKSYQDLAAHFLEQRGRTSRFAFSLLRQNQSVGARSREVRQKRAAFLAQHPDQRPFQLPSGNVARKPALSQFRWQVNALSGKYFQQHTPIRQLKVPVGHAVRFGYLETATALLARQRGDPTLLPALEQAWEHMVTRRMYVTGGLGSLPGLEGFGRDYELDPEFAYAETCAALAGLFWNWQMALATGKAKYSDLFEWQLYNAALVGMGLSGESYLYNNPLACRGGIVRRPWFAVPCCPSNLSRTLADLGKYAYSYNSDTIWVHQYFGGQVRLPLVSPVELEMQSELPWNGRVRILINPAAPVDFTLQIRLPSWSHALQATLLPAGSEPAIALANPEKEIALPAVKDAVTAQGYDPRRAIFLPIQRRWQTGDVVELDFGLSIDIRRAHPTVKGHAGKLAVTRGPLVYCLESVDHPDLDIFSAHLDPESLRSEWAPDVLDGVTILRAKTTSGKPLLFIPYQLWANRGPSQMTVWIST